MAERTFEEEKNRLIDEGADPNLFDVPIVQRLLTKLINDPEYGKVDDSGEVEIVHVNPNGTGTFDIRTKSINGHTMEKYKNGDIRLHKIEVSHHKRALDQIGKSYGKRTEDVIVFNEDGEVIEQSWYSARKYGYL